MASPGDNIPLAVGEMDVGEGKSFPDYGISVSTSCLRIKSPGSPTLVTGHLLGYISRSLIYLLE